MNTRTIKWSALLSASLIAAVIFSCAKKETVSEATPSGLNWQAIANKLVERSNLQPGEQVVIVAAPGRFDSLVLALAHSIAQTGASYLGAISVDSLNQPESWSTDFVKAAKGKSLTDLTAHFGEIDLGIMLPGASPEHMPYAALQEILNMGHGRTIHFHWSGAYDILGQPKEIDASIDQLYEKVLMETDYDSIAAAQRSFEAALRLGKVQVTTLAGTNLTFTIGDRPVTKQDGNASLARMQEARNLIDREVELPAGAIRVAPLEETVDGTIAFPDGLWDGQKVEGLVLTFAKGKVVNIAAKKGQESVKAELDKAGDAGYSFRELAVGFNPMLAIPQEKPFIPYYGYGAGIVRLSLGDNSELGGNVKGGYVRWNFFIDATLTVGTDIWIKDGVRLK